MAAIRKFGTKLALLIILLGAIFYTASLNNLVPNYTEGEGIIYGTDDYVPAKRFTYTHALLMAIIAIALAFQGVEKDRDATIQEVDRIIRNEIIQKAKFENREEFKGEVTNIWIGQSKIINEGGAKPYKWVAIATLEQKEGKDKYLLFELSIPGQIQKIAKRDTDLTDKDMCGHCGGKLTDIRIMGSKEVQDAKTIRDIFGGGRR